MVFYVINIKFGETKFKSQKSFFSNKNFYLTALAAYSPISSLRDNKHSTELYTSSSQRYCCYSLRDRLQFSLLILSEFKRIN